MRVGWRKSEKEIKVWVLIQLPRKSLFMGYFWFFFKITVLPLHSQIQSIVTTLRFFDVPDSFLMLFSPKNLYLLDLRNHFYIYHSYTLI